ncbi:O-fucosyltransferase family protein [Striga asiatica]|uniref:O-fucosyltransferase family protein n=1 Tax=Striga asiatica TaxID=4170 RepID=A0A5A7P2Y3_STRAF|nr:O-fucosyltransferase family protein [Striga asiatica]
MCSSTVAAPIIFPKIWKRPTKNKKDRFYWEDKMVEFRFSNGFRPRKKIYDHYSELIHSAKVLAFFYLFICHVNNFVAMSYFQYATSAPIDRNLPLRHNCKIFERSFTEVYDLDKFLASLSGVVPIEKALPAKLLYKRLPIVQVPEQVSEEFISSNIMPVYLSKKNLKIVTYFNSSAKVNWSMNQQSNAYQCLAMFESLRLQPWLQKLADSMLGTLRSLSMTMGSRFLVVDFRVEMLGQLSCLDSCLGAQEIGIFLEKIGFHPNTTIYLTQIRWHNSLDALRSIFPNTFIKDAIMPADEKGKFVDMKSRELERYIDYYMCMQGDVFVPALPGRFYTSIVGERIRLGKTQILVPAKNTSETVADYVSPYVAEKSHFVYSCLC